MTEELKADFVRSLPGGKLDDSDYEAIETALDKAGAPCQASDGRWLGLAERIDRHARDRQALVDALKAAKAQMWIDARSTWAMADFKNWAVVQQIDAALTKADGVAR